ncbi:gamma-glutamyl-gamma-aminobutyrate hydrolase family protein [Desulfofarcimen acetoxidans]|uniref:gamma-glutamyl-gamma-aminobutyrate hydrolase family protein n=1 Tax=Desulfofarcimen acetoxidans TaxID=58138 RepID=UPI00019E5334|nr:gamma-glutamyl-gamma-aminobutyrate hydrolase family protein [Desulfofarcimen acetoxidans]
MDLRPLIGITCAEDELNNRSCLARPYYNAVVKAGGLPVLLASVPETEELLDVLDGLIFSGGGDVDPHYFGEEPLPGTGEISPLRDAVEIRLAQLSLAEKIPSLGICRGAQVLNIAAGGALHQDISMGFEKHLKHVQQAPRWCATHNIAILEESNFFSLITEKYLRVNSFHHQVISKMGEGLKACAWSSDGVIEVFESTGDNFILGVQFHPETMWHRDRRFLKIFEALILNTRRQRVKKG